MIQRIENSNVNEYISLVRNRNAGHERYVHVITFGCQQNERDSETILGLCQEMGYMKTDDPEKAEGMIAAVQTEDRPDHLETVGVGVEL